MPIRPGRLLPSVIVGALVTGALALGAGTAAAEDPIVDLGDLLGETRCLLDGDLDAPVLMGDTYDRDSDGVCISIPVRTPTPTPTPTPTTTTTTTSAAPTGPSASEIAQQRERERIAAERQAAALRAQQEAAQREAALAAQRAAQAQAVAPNANLLSPGGAYGGLAATTPALGIGTLDPSLLLAPAGSPLRTLTGVDEGSPVTTVSDVQAMAFDNLPGGLGMPAVTGTLILSAFAAFALRHRVLHRARMAADADTESEADTAEIPAREPVS